MDGFNKMPVRDVNLATCSSGPSNGEILSQDSTAPAPSFMNINMDPGATSSNACQGSNSQSEKMSFSQMFVDGSKDRDIKTTESKVGVENKHAAEKEYDKYQMLQTCCSAVSMSREMPAMFNATSPSAATTCSAVVRSLPGSSKSTSSKISNDSGISAKFQLLQRAMSSIVKRKQVNKMPVSFPMDYFAARHTLDETVNTQCFEAALSERINYKSRLNFNKFATTLKQLKLKQQARRAQIIQNSTQSQPEFLTKAGPSLFSQLKQEEIENLQSQLQEHSQYEEPPKCPEVSQLLNTSEPAPISSHSFSASSHIETAPSPLSGYSSDTSTIVDTRSDWTGSRYSSESEFSGPVPCSPPPVCSNRNLLKMKSLGFGLKGNPEMKKYRYNQTALALQQSGLMKTTVKTAELLRKSRLLQQELMNLRRETAQFVTDVLNNAENKHIKESLIKANTYHGNTVPSSS